MARILTWSLLVLLIVPAVAGGVDLASRSGESIAFTVPPLTFGARASYDLAVVSDFQGTMTAPEAVQIEVTRVHGADPEMHTPPGWLQHRLVIGPTPWDVDQPRLTATYGAPVDAARVRGVVETVRIDDGRVLHRIDHHGDQRWMEREGVVALDLAGRHREWARPDQAGPWESFRQHLTNRYVYEDKAIDALTKDGARDIPVVRAELDGKTVYGWSRTHVHEAQEGQGIGCHLAYPEYTYSELKTMGGHVRDKVWIDAVETHWVAPDQTFPLLTVCTTHYRLDGPDGDVLGTIRFMARLRSADAGTDVVPLKATPGPLAPADPMPATARQSNGLPRDDPSMFRLTLAAAYQSLLESDDETIAAFRADTQPPFIVLTATYDPDQSATPECTLDPALCEALLPTAAPARNAVPSWTFLLQNEYDEQLKVRVARQITPAGEGLPPQVDSLAYVHGAPLAVPLDRIPEELVAPSIVLKQWLQDEQVTLESWRADEKACFEIAYLPDGDKVVPHYTIRADLEASDRADEAGVLKHDASPDWSGTFYHLYRGSDGVLLENGMDETDSTTGPLPEHDADAIAYDAGLRPFEHVPIAGLVAGGITLAALAAALRTDLPTWIRRALWFPLFTKLTKDQVLDHKTRDEMIGYVAANPGVGTEEIRRHFRIGWGTAVYHLAALEQNRLLTSLRTGGHRHWFPAQAMDPRTKQILAMLRSPAAKRLYDAVTHAPGRTQQEIAEVLGVTHGAVIFQVRKLERAGLIRKERDGRFVRYYAEALPGRTSEPAADSG